jgi:hypothetical protein
MKRGLRCAAVACLAALHGAPFAADAAAEHARIRAERAQVQARYADAVRECNRRFVVTSCVEDARAERRQALSRLGNEELVLDQAERRQRAAQRAADIRAKQARGAGAGLRAAPAPARAACADVGRPSAEALAARRGAQPRRLRAAPARGRGASRIGRAAQRRTRGESEAAVAALAGARRRERARALKAFSRAPGRPKPAERPLGAANGVSLGQSVQSSASTRASASDRLSPPPRARWRALATSISLASRGGSALTIAPSSFGVK